MWSKLSLSGASQRPRGNESSSSCLIICTSPHKSNEKECRLDVICDGLRNSTKFCWLNFAPCQSEWKPTAARKVGKNKFRELKLAKTPVWPFKYRSYVIHSKTRSYRPNNGCIRGLNIVEHEIKPGFGSDLCHRADLPSSSHRCTARAHYRSREHSRGTADTRRRADPASRSYTCNTQRGGEFVFNCLPGMRSTGS